MSDDPDGPAEAAAAEPSSGGGPTGLLVALDASRQARRGALAGVAVAVVTYLLFVVAPGAGSPVLYLGLAFVLAFSAGAIVTVALLAVRARRLAAETGVGTD